MKVRIVGTWDMYFFAGTERHGNCDQNKIQPLKFLFLQAAQRRREIIEQALAVRDVGSDFEEHLITSP